MTPAKKCGLDDAFAQGMTLAEIDSLIEDHLPEPAPEWDPPIPLIDPIGPPFPLEALPGIIGAFVAAVAEETQTPPDLAAVVTLATISAASGGKYEVVIPEQGWREPVHIQAISVAEPGTRKSGIFRKVTTPIVEYERSVQPDERRALAQWESRGRMLEKAVASTESSASKAPQDGKLPNSDAIRMAAVDALEAHRAERPRVTRLIGDDATSESVKTLLAEQGGAIAVMSAESAFLSNTAGGRYGKDGSPNLDVLLNGHAGDSVRVDRQGRPAETIERACLTLCLMVQPHVIRDLGKVPGFITRGAAARILPCFPADILGRRRIDVTPVPAHLVDAWSEIVTRVVERKPTMRGGSYVPWPLHLDAEAGIAFRAYRAWHEPQMSKDGALGDIRDWAGKQCGAVLRIACLLHIVSHGIPENVPLTADTLQLAIAIVGYFEQHARIMYRLMRGRSGHVDARAVLAALGTLNEPTTRRDVHRKLHNRIAFATSDDLSSPLHLLEEYGWIKRIRQGNEQGGRPSELIFLNPLAQDDKTDKTAERGRSVGFVIDSLELDNVTPIRPEPSEPDSIDVVEHVREMF